MQSSSWPRSRVNSAMKHLEDNAAAARLSLSGEVLAALEVAAGRTKWSGDRRSFATQHTRRASGRFDPGHSRGE